MDTNKFTPCTLATESSKMQLFNIPLYQRLFEWGEEQIERLMYDLHQAYLYNKDKPYYIGMLTTRRRDDDVLDLVDGQQRFTVMMLLGVVFDWKEFTIVDKNPRLNFAARHTDEQYLIYILGLLTKSAEITPNYKMEKGIGYIRKYLTDNNLNEDADFGDFVYKKLTFFVSELEPGYSMTELNTYFERMNTTGKALAAHEILKVTLLGQVRSDKKKEYTQLWNACSRIDQMLYRPTRYNKELKEEEADTNSYNRCRDTYNWAMCRILQSAEGTNAGIMEVTKSIMYKNEDAVKGKKIGQVDVMDDPVNNNPNKKAQRRKNVFTLLTFPEFLLQVLYITLGCADDCNSPKEIHLSSGAIMPTTDFFNVHKLNETFSYFINDIDIEGFFRNLLLYRLITDYFLVRYSDNDEDPYPFQLYYDKGRKKEIKQYETMLYSASASMTFYYWVAPFLVWLGNQVKKQSDIYLDEAKMLRTLQTLDGVWHPNPFDGQSEDDVAESLRYGYIDRYYFWRIDYYLWKSRDTIFTNENEHQLANDYIFRRNRSIEHIAPQHYREDKKYFNWNELPQEDAILKDDIGNLCMISSGQNSSLKDSAFEEKRGHIESFLASSISGHVESLKMLYVYSNYPIWTLENIRKHHEDSITFLRDSYDKGLI